MKRRSGLPSSNQTDCWGAKQTGGLRAMSALGQKPTSRQFRAMSVILLKANIHQRGFRVRFVPGADMRACRVADAVCCLETVLPYAIH